ncbi:MAG: hypothetical protein IPG71_02435 [bacterium]|nr:hypothetical protein [bacterium]
MKLFFLTLSLLCVCGLAFAQNISNAEYFFDSDPGFGNGIALTLTASDTPSVSASADLSALSPGLHRCYVRFQDERGFWSIADARLFYLLSITTPDTSDNIIAAEYFFNSDPGQGSGTSVALTEGPDPSISFPVDVEALPPGLHRFYLRYQDEFSRWSIADARLFYITQVHVPQYSEITAAEYFFNDDPGFGNGTSLAVVPGEEPMVAGELSTAGLPDGLNRFYLRYRDDRNRWSIADARLFYIIRQSGNSEVQTLAGAEFFINVDPGFGLGEPLVPIDGVWDDTLETVMDSVTSIPIGKHILGLRYLDNRGNWSTTAVDTFVVGPLLTAYPDGSLASIVLFWQTGPDPATFDVQRATGSTGAFNTIATVTDSTYTDTGVLNSPEYIQRYQVVQNSAALSNYRYPDPAMRSARARIN